MTNKTPKSPPAPSETGNAPPPPAKQINGGRDWGSYSNTTVMPRDPGTSSGPPPPRKK